MSPACRGRRRPRHQARARVRRRHRRRRGGRGDRRGRLRRGAGMSAAAKLAGFAACSALVFGVAAVAGGAIGPDRDGGDAERRPRRHGGDGRRVTARADGGHEADPIRGLAVAEDGLRLSLAATTLPRGARDHAALRDRRRERPRARLRGHAREADAPDRRAPRRARLPAPAPGARRRRHVEHADHAARRGRLPRVRGLQARRRGAHARRRPDRRRRRRLRAAARAPRRRYRDRRVHASSSTPHGDELGFAITRDGKPVETEPYLGAGGHLVALREGDLAFLHVHPTDGDGVAFETDLDPDSRYRLYLQFKHDGRVHTAEFTR